MDDIVLVEKSSIELNETSNFNKEETDDLVSRIKAYIPNAIDAINRIESIDDARYMVDEVDRFYYQLNAWKVFAECVNMFCELEARLWVHIANAIPHASVSNKFTSSEQKIISWLKSKKRNNINDIITKCANGVRISCVMNSEKRKAQSMNRESRELDELKMIKNRIITEAKTSGVTTLTKARFYREWKLSGKPDAEAVGAFVEDTKKTLLRTGVLGVGDGHGTYINPSIATNEDMALIIANRLKGIIIDVQKVRVLCTKASVAISIPTARMLHDAIDEFEVA